MNLTVAIPARNAGQTIGHVLRALRSQLEKNDRIIVADDGSSDRTSIVANHYSADVIRIAESNGLAAARNVLLAAVETELVLFLDADAIPASNLLKIVRAGFTEPEVVGVGGRGIELDSNSISARWRATVCPQDHGLEIIEADWMLMGLCMCFRTMVLKQAGGFNPRYRGYGEDVEISLRIRRSNNRLRYLPEAVIYHLKTDGFFSVLQQGYRHAGNAAHVLAQSGEEVQLTQYRRDVTLTLWRTSVQHFIRGRIGFALVGLANLTVRIWAIYRGISNV